MQYLLLFLLIITTSLQASDTPSQNDIAKISVQASAKILANADYMNLNLNVSHEAKTVKAAKKEVDKAAKQLFRIFKQFSIAKTDQDASYIRSQSVYHWRDNKREKQGELVSRSIQIKLRDINKLADLTHALLQVSHTHIQGQQLGFNNLKKYQNKALKQAVAQAKIKAKMMLEATGQTLGDAILIEEGQGSNTMPISYNNSMLEKAVSSSAEPAPMPISKREIMANVRVVFSIK